MVNYIESPLERIVAVHWGGGPVVVAEVPSRLADLLSLTPSDPDANLVSVGTYPKDQVIPKADYDDGKLFDTTANLTQGSPIIDGIVDTYSYLAAGIVYKISGTGIPADTRMTYQGGGSGVLSDNATANIANGAVEIRLKIWQLQVIVDMPPSDIEFEGTVYTAQFVAEVETGDASYFVSPLMLFQSQIIGTDDAAKRADVDAHYNALIAQGYPDYSLMRQYGSDDPKSHNGVNFGTFPYSIFQIVRTESEQSDVFLINMANTSLVQVNQLVYREPWQNGQTGNFIPGYLESGGGTKLTAYSSATQFSLSAVAPTVGGFGQFPSLIVQAKTTALDPITGLPVDAVPLWTATIPPTESSPADTVEIARFDAKGLVAAHPPVMAAD